MSIIKAKMLSCVTSCPSRGTWIEMGVNEFGEFISGVVPLAGHVD